jgi:hypothetical protein
VQSGAKQACFAASQAKNAADCAQPIADQEKAAAICTETAGTLVEAAPEWDGSASEEVASFGIWL